MITNNLLKFNFKIKLFSGEVTGSMRWLRVVGFWFDLPYQDLKSAVFLQFCLGSRNLNFSLGIEDTALTPVGHWH